MGEIQFVLTRSCVEQAGGYFLKQKRLPRNSQGAETVKFQPFLNISADSVSKDFYK